MKYNVAFLVDRGYLQWSDEECDLNPPNAVPIDPAKLHYEMRQFHSRLRRLTSAARNKLTNHRLRPNGRARGR